MEIWFWVKKRTSPCKMWQLYRNWLYPWVLFPFCSIPPPLLPIPHPTTVICSPSVSLPLFCLLVQFVHYTLHMSESRGTCLCLTGFFHVAWCCPGPSMLLQRVKCSCKEGTGNWQGLLTTVKTSFWLCVKQVVFWEKKILFYFGLFQSQIDRAHNSKCTCVIVQWVATGETKARPSPLQWNKSTWHRRLEAKEVAH